MAPRSAHGDTLWPAVTYERLTWLVGEGGDGRRSTRGRRYDSALIPEIADAEMMLPSECALISEDVRTAIAAFDLRVGDRLAPLEALLVRIESAASSRIENVATPIPELFLADVDDDGGRSANEVLGNVDATTAAIILAEDITPESILDMHRALLRRSHPVLAGKWRDEPVWIGTYSAGPPGATFVPPAAHRVPAAMEDLCLFVDRSDIPVFIQAMVMHAHFETIHPFPDGNGRVGRALIHALLRREGLTRAATLPISAGIVSQKHRYVEALDEYRGGDFLPIVELGADAVFAAIRNAGHLHDDVERIIEHWRELAAEERADSAVHRVVGGLAAHPVFGVADVAAWAEIRPPTARRAIARIADLGIVRPMEGTRWIAHELIGAVNSFIDRAINPYGRH
ncbi:MAG: Fic family protein [Actinomycetota bacterium]